MDREPQGLENFKISETNPNDQIGGKGCACSPHTEPSGREGPFVIFHAASTDERLSPHVVVCAGCICAAARKLRDESEVLRSSEES